VLEVTCSNPKRARAKINRYIEWATGSKPKRATTKFCFRDVACSNPKTVPANLYQSSPPNTTTTSTNFRQFTNQQW
jgi:hypothetical protein